ncbi:MAG: AAA family ATPase, partial [Planctomycetota bacterium]|nr:AAA family ATPase [Planctomycetota bacterium]
VMELLTETYIRVHGTVTPAKVVELFNLGEGSPPKYGIRTAELVAGFYSFLGFTRLLSDAAIRQAVARGVEEHVFGYTAGDVPELGTDGKYQVPRARVRFGISIPEDEVDLEAGFIMLPQAIPQPEPVVPSVPGATPPGLQPGATPLAPPPTSATGGPTPPAPALQREVMLSFSADRNKLYTAWSAIANLAEMAGKVNISVRAESDKGFDKVKLQNGVLEPLREADLIE